jgi:methylated-DNA-[protein]-cysteine S-methyltransferase
MISAVHESPLGPITLVSDGMGLTGIYFPVHKGGPKGLPPAGEDAIVLQARRELDGYFAGRREHFEIAVRPQGTPFQIRVWSLLLGIKYGHTESYGALAHALGNPNASRAVGAAVGRNPISIIVPCHRVIGAAGALTGFAGGLERKRALLALEAGEIALLSA